MTAVPQAAAIVLAGGSGERFGRQGGKQLAQVAGRSVLAWTLSSIDATQTVDLIVLVRPHGRHDEYVSLGVEPAGISKPVFYADSGTTRQDSVFSGLSVLPDSVSVIAVHDGARPLVTPEAFDRCVRLVREPGVDGAVLGHPAVDTLKIVDERRIIETPDRQRYWYAQTPQVFQREALERAHAQAARDGFCGTDDSAIVERSGGRVLMVEGPRDNVKVTVAEDLAFVEAVLSVREGSR